MVHALKGTVVAISDPLVILDVGLMQLAIAVPNAFSCIIGKEITLFIHMQWNQEQGPSLYGFISELERTLFLLITSCSGIGPKIGLAILQSMNPQEFIGAIEVNDHKALSKINGIGAKKAEQIIVHLRHKVEKLLSSGAVVTSKNYSYLKDVSDALGSLNYSRPEIQGALDFIRMQENIEQLSFDQLFRTALQFLSKQ